MPVMAVLRQLTLGRESAHELSAELSLSLRVALQAPVARLRKPSLFKDEGD
jgi:hypothetical protein